ncbi:MAG: hypothetical protein ACI92A_002527, partial [Candidatus Paceibacteria bacterium]
MSLSCGACLLAVTDLQSVIIAFRQKWRGAFFSSQLIQWHNSAGVHDTFWIKRTLNC